jgi:hypothetical protein
MDTAKMTNSLDVQMLVDELVKKVNELQTQNIMMSALNRQLQEQVQMLSQSLGDLSTPADDSEEDS